jgi:PD-(D/E)XK nuclease superfamily
MTALAHVSASQIKDFVACNRLWYYTRILKQRAPQTEAQSRGTTVHGALEAHLKAGKIEPEILERAKGLGITEETLQEYVEAMKPFVGQPGEGLTEYRDEMPTYEGGPKYVLVVDHAREIVVEGHGVIPQIDDLKTTSDFRYCKTPDELSKDVQMVSYAKWALLRLYLEKSLPPPSFVSLRHVYVRTRGKRLATARDVLVTPADVEARWSNILGVVREMELLSARGAELNPQDVHATTTDHCSAYGGCFFRAQCFGAVYDTSRPFMGLFNKEKTAMSDVNGTPRLSLKERVAQKAAGGAVPAVAPAAAAAAAPAAPSAAPSAAPTCGNVNGLFPGCPCTLVLHEGDHESEGPGGGKIHWSFDGKTFGIGASTSWKALAPMLTLVPAETVTPAAAAPAAAAAAPATAASVLAAFVPSAAVAAVLPPDAASRTSTPEEVAAEGTTKRKRATKAEMEARAAGATGTVAAATPAAAPAPALAPIVVVAPPGGAVAGNTVPASVVVAGVCPLKDLYVDCLPVKPAGVVYGLGEDLLHSLSIDAAHAAGMPDWRLVEFGKGKGAMAVLLRERLASMPEILVVSSSTPGSDVLLEVLTPHARRVVRALRG